MTDPGPAPRPPGRAVLRLAGGLTQLVCASCLLLGTIAFVLVHQNQSAGAELVIGWAVGALVGLVFGGLMTRGGLTSLVLAALIDATAGTVLLALEYDTVRAMLRILPSPDVDLIADVMTGAGVAMLCVFALCVAAIPQALRYTRWMHAETEPRLASSTARGFPPPPFPAGRVSVWQMPIVAPDERSSRRRLYFALAGFAIGFGAGIGVLVSSTTGRGRAAAVATTAGTTANGSTTNTAAVGSSTPQAPVVGVSGSGSGSGSGLPAVTAGRETAGKEIEVPLPPIAPPPPPVATLIDAQRAALAAGNLDGVIATLAPTAFGFGATADAVADGRDALAAALRRDLGELPPGGQVEARFTAIGEAAGHAWIALELELAGADGSAPRRFAVTQLAAPAPAATGWHVVAWHWAVPLADATAERQAILGSLPMPAPIPSAASGPPELAAAVRAAFASRRAFAEARSAHPEGFNFGSAPGERIRGGDKVKRVFSKLRAELRLHDGVRIAAVSPLVAYAAANVDFTAKTRAATDLTQTFRVLAVLLFEDGAWKIVQTQWSHGS